MPESDDVAIALALTEEENTLATASNIELARRLAERPAVVYQEIAIEEGQSNLAITEVAQAAPEEPTPPHCLVCDRTDHLSEIQDVGHLCFSCLQHNFGAELDRLVFN